MLGGRIAEEVNYGTLGVGALSDLERATKMTYAMVTWYGMSKKIGPISYYDSTGTRDTFTKPFSEQTAVEIDSEVRRILEEAYARGREIIEINNDKINAMADLLLEKETIYAEDIEVILGPSAQSLNKMKEAEQEKPTETSTPKSDTNEGVTIEPEPELSPATKDNVENV
jgi:cell division protease FtsH